MRGTVFPRPAKLVTDRRSGRTRKAPLRPHESWTDPGTGRMVTAGAEGSTWSYSFTTGTRAAGNRQSVQKGGFATKAEAEAALADGLAALGRGDRRGLLRPSAQPLGEYLRDWLAGRDDLKATTSHGYDKIINAWIVPHVGHVPLCDVTPDVLVGLYATLRERGGRATTAHPEGRPLGTRSVQTVHVVVSMALADAVEAGKLAHNPAAQIPKRQKPKHRNRRQADRYWTPEQAQAFLEATADSRWYAYWALALDTGMRRGEMCGLHWDAVDLDAGVVWVRTNRVVTGSVVHEYSTKSERARQVDIAPQTTDALKAWRKRLAQEKLAVGEDWAGDLEAGHVFVAETGETPRPDWFNNEFERATKDLGLPKLSPHGLRHTAATLALARGLPAHVAQERLGHADVAITLGLYSHVTPGQQAEAARIMGSALYGS